MFSQILDLIKEYDTIIIHRHSNPDGDAIGSQVGLKNIIKHNFPQKRVFAVGDSAKRYSFISDSECDQIEDDIYANALAIILDTSASALISDDRYKLAKATARFDHHIFCEKIADVEHTDTTQESCCGLIAQFARECGLALNDIAAEALFTGMVTDSGRFKYDSVNSNTFLNASFLMQHKIDTNEIYKNLYADDYEYLKLRAQFVLKINFVQNDQEICDSCRQELGMNMSEEDQDKEISDWHKYIDDDDDEYDDDSEDTSGITDDFDFVDDLDKGLIDDDDMADDLDLEMIDDEDLDDDEDEDLEDFDEDLDDDDE